MQCYHSTVLFFIGGDGGDKCYPNPCLNHGVCISCGDDDDDDNNYDGDCMYDKKFKCLCRFPFHGKYCEKGRCTSFRF